MTKEKNILIIGKPASGKTTFMAKLYEKLEMESELSLNAMPEDISIIETAQERLYSGLAVEHTKSHYHEKFDLPLKWGEKELTVGYPDYGGEQINAIIEEREVSEKWRKRVDASDHWLLFIKLDELVASKDITTVTTRPIQQKKLNNEPINFKLSHQAFFIELLQILLYVKGLGLHRNIKTPKICVALNCWDTLDNTKLSPIEYMKEHLPLLFDFISSNWAKKSCSFIGLSSQGKVLDVHEADEEYLEKGSHEFGYVVKSNGEKHDDLTWVIANLLTEK